jgi:transcription elongation factor/antiterminator RfaH
MRASVEEFAAQSGAILALTGQERWFVVRTQPHREAQAERQLANQDYRIFLPRFRKSRRHARKFEIVSAPLFPGYLFVILDLTRDRWRSVNGTHGVDRLLTRAGAPEPVPHGLVEQLLTAIDAEGVVRLHPNLQFGQMVRVSAGPFAGLVGRLQQLDDSGRVRILLEILGGKVPVLLSEACVLPTDHVA